MISGNTNNGPTSEYFLLWSCELRDLIVHRNASKMRVSSKHSHRMGQKPGHRHGSRRLRRFRLLRSGPSTTERASVTSLGLTQHDHHDISRCEARQVWHAVAKPPGQTLQKGIKFQQALMNLSFTGRITPHRLIDMEENTPKKKTCRRKNVTLVFSCCNRMLWISSAKPPGQNFLQN